MQEEVDEKTMALVISGGKISAGILKDALARYVRHVEERRRLTRTEKREEKRAERAAAEKVKENEFRPGKKSLNSMMKEGSQLTNIEITDKNIKSFEKMARKYYPVGIGRGGVFAHPERQNASVRNYVGKHWEDARIVKCIKLIF